MTTALIILLVLFHLTLDAAGFAGITNNKADYWLRYMLIVAAGALLIYHIAQP